MISKYTYYEFESYQPFKPNLTEEFSVSQYWFCETSECLQLS